MSGTRVWTTIHIGGPIADDDVLNRLQEAIDDGDWEQSDSVMDALEERRYLTLQGHQSWGTEDDLEDFCKENGLFLWKHFDGDGAEWSAGIEFTRPGEDTVTRDADGTTYEPTIDLRGLREAVAAGLTIKDVLAQLEAVEPEKVVPPLTLSGAAPAVTTADFAKGGRVQFTEAWDIFPHCVVGAGELATVEDVPAGEHGTLCVKPDNRTLQAALAEWDGCVVFTADDNGRVPLRSVVETAEAAS